MSVPMMTRVIWREDGVGKCPFDLPVPIFLPTDNGLRRCRLIVRQLQPGLPGFAAVGGIRPVLQHGGQMANSDPPPTAARRQGWRAAMGGAGICVVITPRRKRRGQYRLRRKGP